MNIAIIPARSGSKRIPRKNIKDFCGKPILAYAIESAKCAGIFDEIIISTDSAEIQAVAQNFGAESTHLREDFYDDFATTLEVLSYEAERLKLQKSDSICCIYPCTPLLQSDFLKRGFEKFLQNPTRYVFSACEYSANPLRSFFVKDDKIQMLAEYFCNSSLTRPQLNNLAREFEKSVESTTFCRSERSEESQKNPSLRANPQDLRGNPPYKFNNVDCHESLRDSRNDENIADSTNLATTRSQDLEKLYFDAGQFYFGSAENFLAKKPIFSLDSAIIEIPQIFVSDINTLEDWEIAELKYRILSQNLAQTSQNLAQTSQNLAQTSQNLTRESQNLARNLAK